MSKDSTVIHSKANPLIQRVRQLVAGKCRDELVLEGDRLVADALSAGLRIDVALVSADRADKVRELQEQASAGADGTSRIKEIVLVEPDLLGRVSGLKTSPGLIALCQPPLERSLADCVAGPAPLVLVVAGISDPGNLGALARSAEAAGADALVVVAGGALPWSDKSLRGSMGSLLRLPVVRTDSADETAAELAGLGLRQCIAATRGGTPFERFRFQGPLALWVGSETGEAPVVCASMEQITIQMAGEVESLNVAVATSVLLFAAGRNVPTGGGD